jgi:hypothetical protein
MSVAFKWQILSTINKYQGQCDVYNTHIFGIHIVILNQHWLLLQRKSQFCGTGTLLYCKERIGNICIEIWCHICAQNYRLQIIFGVCVLLYESELLVFPPSVKKYRDWNVQIYNITWFFLQMWNFLGFLRTGCWSEYLDSWGKKWKEDGGICMMRSFHNLCFFSHMISVIKLMRMRCLGHVAWAKWEMCPEF